MEAGTYGKFVEEQERPSPAATSGEGGAYKPMAKWRRAGRESEGPIVPLKAVKAAGGKGPCFGHAWDGVTCEGMP